MTETRRLKNAVEKNVKKHFKFNNFSQTFYCGMIRLRNTNLSVFIQWQYTRTILRKKNMGHLFNKHSKFQNFDETFYCGMNKVRNTNLYVFIQCQYTRSILRKRIWDRICLRKFLILNKLFYYGKAKLGHK